jgi:hypothetical protein
MPINISLLKEGDKRPDNFNTPLIQLNQGKEDRIPFPEKSGLVLTSDINGNKTWIENIKLGNTSSTAFRGDYGQIAFNHSQLPHDYYAKTGGKITGDVEITGTLTLSTTNKIQAVSADTVVTSNGFLKVVGLGIKLDSPTNDFTIRPYNGVNTKGVGLYINSDLFSFGKWQEGQGPQDEMVLFSSMPKVYIGDQVRAQNISAPIITAGTSQLDSTGLSIGGHKVIDSSGTISGANIDLVADYESPWIYVSGGNTFSIPHNLGIRPRFYQIVFSHDNSNSDTKQVFTIPHIQTTANNYWWYWWYGWNGYGANCYTLVESYDNIHYWIRTGDGGVYTNANNRYSSGYVKIMFWK